MTNIVGLDQTPRTFGGFWSAEPLIFDPYEGLLSPITSHNGITGEVALETSETLQFSFVLPSGQYLAGSHKIENFDKYITYFKSAAAQIRRNRKQITGKCHVKYSSISHSLSSQKLPATSPTCHSDSKVLLNITT